MGHYECNRCGQEMSHCVCGKESPANYAWQPTPGTLNRLTEEAQKRNISVSKLIRDFVEAGLGHEGPG